jgi:hypothetical protein
MGMRTSVVAWAAGVALCAGLALGQGSVFVTGHDPDFHARQGGNTTGARRMNQVGVGFIMDPGFNPYVVGGATKFLFVQSNIAPPGGHINGKLGILDSGFVEGVHFDHHTASTLNAALNQLGTVYGGIVVASDFGGILTQAELDILNARAPDIFSFVNTGGGIYAMAEGNNGAGLTPNGGWFNYIPQFTAAAALNQTEVGYTVSAFGASLGLTNADVNGNASHNIFTAWSSGLQPVNFDAQGRVMTLAGRTRIPSPGTGAVLALMGVVACRRRR